MSLGGVGFVVGIELVVIGVMSIAVLGYLGRFASCGSWFWPVVRVESGSSRRDVGRGRCRAVWTVVHQPHRSDPSTPDLSVHGCSVTWTAGAVYTYAR